MTNPPIPSNRINVPRWVLAAYTTAITYLVVAGLLRETQPESQTITMITWTSIAYGAACIMHLAGKAAAQRFLSWLKRELGGPSQPPGDDV
ncbi:hypothetical protein ACFYZ4_22950 [Streptomyces sp. NPDC001513]|uniref:hypothetical protein n=1 Tax=Streptomyces sp. NPDC001513 TaxID=3364580 RepID=UPI0036ADA35F